LCNWDVGQYQELLEHHVFIRCRLSGQGKSWLYQLLLLSWVNFYSFCSL
jgi:hypothetical protein